MTYIQARKESLLQEADRLEKEQFKKQIALLQEYYQKDEVRNQVKEAFSTLLGEWDRKDVAFSPGIHYLYTNLHNRTYGYRLVLYGEAFYLDEKAIEISWKPELFFALVEEDVGEILKSLRKQFPRLCAYEEELVRYHCAAYYQAAICQLCRDMWGEIVASEAFERLPNMYTHNCDTVVRDILIMAEPSLFLLKPLPPLTPNASYNSFLVQNQFEGLWREVIIGNNSLDELLLGGASNKAYIHSIVQGTKAIQNYFQGDKCETE